MVTHVHKLKIFVYINCLNVLCGELWELQLGITLSCNTQKQCNVSRERD